MLIVVILLALVVFALDAVIDRLNRIIELLEKPE